MELKQWQVKAEIAVQEAWVRVLRYEEAAFGTRSYAYNVVQGKGQRRADGGFIQPEEDFSRADADAEGRYARLGELAEAELPCDLEVPLPGIDNSDVVLGARK